MKRIVFFTMTLLSMSQGAWSQGKGDETFPSWNACEALTTLTNFVEDVTNPESDNYISEEDRIATFDMDGTFLGELYPTYFEYNMLEYRVLDDPLYKDFASEDEREAAQNIRDFVRQGTPLPKDFDIKHAQAAAKAYAGMSVDDFDGYVRSYAANNVNGFSGMTYGESFYQPMLEVMEYLEKNGFTFYVVSGSDRGICRSLVAPLGIRPERVIGMDVYVAPINQEDNDVRYTMGKDEWLVRTDSLIIKNLKTNKVLQIYREIGKKPVLSFGNSSGDEAMHNYCLSNTEYRTEVFMLVADDDVRDHADLAEGARREKRWREAGYNVISMKNDFRTIYGDGVEKTPFNFDPAGVNAVRSEASGIDNGGWYTLGGVKLNGEPTQEGVYINKEKKRLKY